MITDMPVDDVVDDHGHAGGFGNGGEVPDGALFIGREQVVNGCDLQGSHPEAGDCLAAFDGLPRTVGDDASDYRHSPASLIDGPGDEPAQFGASQRLTLASAAADGQAVHSG